MGRLSKFAICGHETWQLAEVPGVAHILSFYAMGVEIELIFALLAAFSVLPTNF